MIAAAAGLAALGGCATLTEDSTEQLLELHTVQENREVTGVGCVLSNKLGRWFVVAPGRVRVSRYSAPLTVDCGREGIGRTVEVVRSRYDTKDLMATAVTTGGAGVPGGYALGRGVRVSGYAHCGDTENAAARERGGGGGQSSVLSSAEVGAQRKLAP
jgi:hypothetical protein